MNPAQNLDVNANNGNNDLRQFCKALLIAAVAGPILCQVGTFLDDFMAGFAGPFLLVILLRGWARWLLRSPIPVVNNNGNKNMKQFCMALLVAAAAGPILRIMANWVDADMAAHVASILVCVLLRGGARRLLGSRVGAVHNNNDNMRQFGKALLIAAAAGPSLRIMANCLDIFMARTVGPVIVIFLLRGSTRRLLRAPTRAGNTNAAGEPAAVGTPTAIEEQAPPAAPSPSPPQNDAGAAGSPIVNQEQPSAAPATASSAMPPALQSLEPAVPLAASPSPLRLKGGEAACRRVAQRQLPAPRQQRPARRAAVEARRRITEMASSSRRRLWSRRRGY